VLDVTDVWVEAEFGMLEEEAVRADEGCGREVPAVDEPLAGMDDTRDFGTGMEGKGPVG